MSRHRNIARNPQTKSKKSKPSGFLRARVMLVAALCLITAALAATIISTSAATPSNGTLSPTSGALTYTGGPFANDNQSAPTADVSPQCVGTVLPCDDFSVTVSIPTGSTTRYDVDVNVGWTDTGGTTSDFDVFIFNSSGTRVAYAASSKNPEHVTFPASNGTYKIRTVPFDTPGTVTYNGTVQLIPVGSTGGSTATPTPTPVTPGAPRFQTYLSPNGIADDFGEPSIGSNWLTGNIMAYGGINTEPVRVSFDDCASPARDTWTVTPTITAGSFRELGDPILYTDHDTGRTLVSQLEGGTKQSTTDYTDDDGAHYGPTVGSGINSGVDHQTLGGGPFAPGAPPHSSYPNAIYYCAQDAADANCAISLDGGITFGPAVPMYNATKCTGLHGHVKVGPDGTVYVPNRGCSALAGTPVTVRDAQGVAVSTDNGITWSVKLVTGTKPNSNDPSLGIGADGTLYFAYADGDNHPKVKVSHDKGTTWSNGTGPGIDVGAPFGIVNTAFPVAVAGDANRAAVGFIGTSTSGNPNDAATFRGIWHAYIAMTYDGGQTWTTVDTTPDDPVQIGSICLSGTTCGTDRNLLDFNDMTVDKFGRPLMVYSDGCVAPACTTATAAGSPPYNASRSAKGVIARQSGGKRLFAQYDPNPAEPTLPAAPRVNSVNRNSLGVVHLDWSEPDNGGSALTSYTIYRKAGANGAYAVLATGLTKTTYDDATATAPNTQYFYKVTASNSIGQSANCGEFIPTQITEESACVLPGLTILTDTSDGGQNTPPDPRVDIQKIFVAEPFFGAGVNKLVFTMKTAPSTMTTAQPNGEWYIVWNRLNPDTDFDRYYVAMKSDAGGAVSYEYGKFGVPLATDGSIPNPNANTPVKLGDADAGSYDPQAGVITITLSNSKAENIKANDSLGGLNGRTYFTRPSIGPRSQNIASDITGDGAYKLSGNAVCTPNAAPLASLLASPTSGNIPLTVTFNAGGSSDPDAGDSVVSYTFNFGDGSPAVTQSSPTVQHIYNSAGQFAATLTVADSHGQASTNTAQQLITVNDPSVRMNYAFSGNGGTATASSEYAGGGFPAISAINGDRTGGNWGGSTGGWNDNTRDAYPDSLEVSFNGAKAIDEIRLYTLQDTFRDVHEPTPDMTCAQYGLLDFDVQYWDGSQWVTIQSVTNNDKVMRVFTFPAVTTSKIRVQVNNARAHYSRIVELEAFGAGGQ